MSYQQNGFQTDDGLRLHENRWLAGLRTQGKRDSRVRAKPGAENIARRIGLDYRGYLEALGQ